METSKNQDRKGVPLPFSDYFITLSYTVFLPMTAGLFLISIFSLLLDIVSVLLFTLIFALILIIITGYFFFTSYRELRFYALKVNYFHFTPSIRDLILFLIRQVYSFVFLGLFLVFILSRILEREYDLWIYLVIAVALSLFFQGVMIILSLNSKRKLLATAQEPVNSDILDKLKVKFSDKGLIHEFRFADVQIPSLFLSAGVMSLGTKYICLISRFFNWKLSENELAAVLGHEKGHIKRNHIKKQYIIIGFEGLLRSLRYFTILVYFKFYITLRFPEQFLFWICVILIYSASGFLSIATQYRIYLQEIRADLYSGAAFGFKPLAITLQKLPSILPVPISPIQSDFLRFRISLLRSYEVDKE